MEELRPYDRLPVTVEYKDTVYALDLSYAAVLAASDVTEDDRLDDYTKLITVLDLFVTDSHPVEVELLKAILDLIKEERHDGPKYMDVFQDWPYICAAFQQAYGIDLYKNKSLHILQFRALLQGLPKDTKMSEIIGIRAATIPAPNKHNQQQIAELTRLKTVYALRGNKTSMQAGWAKLFDMLSARAK